MNNEEILQKTLSMTLERLAKQAMAYETEIANLNAQLILIANQQEELKPTAKTRASKTEDTS
jgi:prefoldin subunit 5